MRRLIELSIKAGVALLVLVALMISFLRLFLPHIDGHRQFLVEKIQYITGLPINIKSIYGEWRSYGPTITFKDFSLHNDYIDLDVNSINLDFNIWKSVINFQANFHSVALDHVDLKIKHNLFDRTKKNNNDNQSQMINDIANFFFRRISYFVLRDSQVTFLSPSGESLLFETSKLTWLNTRYHHKADGIINLDSSQGRVGQINTKLDFHSDTNSYFNYGIVYFQVDNINMRPWFSDWLKINTGLNSADLSLATWLEIKKGQLDNGTILLKQGDINWQNRNYTHQLKIDKQQIHFEHYINGWLIDLPDLNLSTDNEPWPNGQLSALWLPDDKNGTTKTTEQLRIRAQNLQIERITPLLSLFSFLNPEALNTFLDFNPHGRLTHLGLDIPIEKLNDTQISAYWQDIGWKAWNALPGINHFNGNLNGNLAKGKLSIGLHDSLVDFPKMFREPIPIAQAAGEFNWLNNEQQIELWSQGLDIQAKSLWVNGDFSYIKPTSGKTQLQILSGIHLYDVQDAWRYYPEPLMGENLVNYLTSALVKGQANNATLLYFGDPNNFPYHDNSGIFQVWVPLRNTIFKFQPDWLPLTELGIDLNFINDGLWMSAEHGKLGNIDASNITANIPAYHFQKVIVNAHLNGQGEEFTKYLLKSPLKDSVGSALQSTQILGNVNGDLHLLIPTEGEQPVAVDGKIDLKNNEIYLSMLNSTLSQVTGPFTFHGSTLTSQLLSANWFAQPITLRFSTQQAANNYNVGVIVGGKWRLEQLPGFPEKMKQAFSAQMDWNGNIAVTLPKQKEASYNVKLQGKLKNISEQLQTLLSLKNTTLPVMFNAKGTETKLIVTGNISDEVGINTLWQMGSDYLQLKKGIWQTNSAKIPELPQKDVLQLSLPKFDGNLLINLLTESGINKKQIQASQTKKIMLLPKRIEVSTSSISLFGQYWRDVALSYQQLTGQNYQLVINGSELRGELRASPSEIWSANIDYLYYNPYTKLSQEKSIHKSVEQTKIDFRNWPQLDIKCKECWFIGQNYNMISARLLPSGNTLLLKNGQVKTENTLVSLEGQWHQTSHANNSSFSGKVRSTNFDQTMRHFGVVTPINQAPTDINFSLQWQGYPWQPQIETLSGSINAELGKGVITSIDVGRTGQILRMVSITSLIRKLQLDFSNSFTKGFDFNSIRMHGSLKNGILHTHNTLIDGSLADIAINGDIDLTKNKLSLEAMVAPEISMPVGVATAVAVNPIVGVAVFAATKVLAPLWSKISFIRYSITGDFDNPSVDEIFRQSKEKIVKE